MQITYLGNNKAASYHEVLGALQTQGFQPHTYCQEEKIDGVVEAFKTVRDLVIGSDLIIADISLLAAHSAYQLSVALEYRRPTLLVVSAKQANLGDVLALKNRNLEIKTYRNKEELEKVVAEFTEGVKNSLDAKLFMNIPPSMNKYLDWVATHTEFNKSDVVRDAVERTAQEDKQYQAFLRSLDK